MYIFPTLYGRVVGIRVSRENVIYQQGDEQQSSDTLI